MLDPLTALSTASAVVQLVDFGMRILDDSQQLYTEGNLVTLKELKTITQDLVHVNHLLIHRAQPKDTSEDPVSDVEKSLDKLAAECSDVAAELIACLESLDTTAGIGRWKSFCQAVRSRWNLPKIREMETRIKSFREQLTIRVLAVLNHRTILQAARQEQRFDRLDQSHADVIDIVAINRQLLQSSLHTDVSALSQAISQSEANAQTRHNEISAAILKLRDGSSMVITGEQDNERSDFIARETIMTLKKPVLNHVDFHVQDFGVVQSKVLDCLHFREIDHRYNTVLDAHRNTYEWIYQNPETNDKPWSNFVQFLEQGHGCYWVNGKAGSGKSTLMKFIHSHPQTARSLSVWAENQELVVASFFLSNLGNSLQKSPNGLIRSLLFEALAKHRHLIPLVVPDLCRAAANLDHKDKLSEPTFNELAQAFQNLIRDCSANLRLCFFIDGVDECEGDYWEILELLASASKSKQVKIIVSSRPITPCVAAFSGFPNLRLQDITHDDMMLYVNDKLKVQLERRVGAHAHALILEIVERASGVFLWIIVVVKSLLLGVHSMDRIDDLQRRVDELPADLMELYSHMLRNITPLYKQQALQIFQLVLNSVGVESGEEITTLQLSFADQSPLEAKKAPIREISSAEESRRVEEMDGRIRSRCCGLLEIRDRRYSGGILTTIHRPTVAFLHRTVYEFLTEQMNSKDWLDLTAGNPDFDAQLSLASSCVLLAKSLPQQRAIDRDSLPWQSIRCCLHHCSMVEQQHAITTELLYELNRTVSHQFAKVWSPGHETSEQKFWAVAPPFRGALPSKHSPDCFLSLSVTWGLSFFLQDELDRNEHDIKQLEKLLHIAVSSFILTWSDILTHSTSFLLSQPVRIIGYARIISTLLSSGVSPNNHTKDPKSRSPWEDLLHHLHDLLVSDRTAFLRNFNQDGGYSQTLLDLIVVMVVSAADPNAAFIWKTKHYRDVEHPTEFRLSALRVIELLPFDEMDDISHDRSWHVVPEDQRPIVQYRTRLIAMLKERGAQSKEWTCAAGSEVAGNKSASDLKIGVVGAKSKRTSRSSWKRISRVFRSSKVG
ncbi:hypothetical protein N7457_005638 [Penicillium paradoxum]|uniref:uncharacterized protein n=1 Tax=Penicillium paradoxum TaxID=176176 RepID=UPI00254671DA|nr:uncharacterized protein N7457_005638 [Penicillium paradoxum]KAJ5780478.1 hypothetical protein N7457_005638 [Penicillium paradoxum]